MTIFGNRVVTHVLSQDEVILEEHGTLIQSDWCPYKKQPYEGRDAHGEKAM